MIVKDNIDSGDKMQTTAGSLALAGSIAAQDAPLVAGLRRAGAVLLGKANLSEWANFRSTRSTSGWSNVQFIFHDNFGNPASGSQGLPLEIFQGVDGEGGDQLEGRQAVDRLADLQCGLGDIPCGHQADGPRFVRRNFERRE